MDRRGTRLLVALLGIGMLLGPTLTWQNRHARFLLFSHAAAAGPLAEIGRTLSDFDRDGAAATWAGGDDCAPFDAARAPAEREVPADGIDQDCTGADAPVLAAADWRAEGPAGCQPLNRPSVILITVDALRGDILPLVTPHLEQLAKLSLVFSRAYAPATVTGDSMASVFTGLPFSDLSAGNPVRGGERLTARPTFIERFRAAGYQTVAFNFFKHREETVAGFEERNPFWVDPHARGLTHHFTSAALTNGVLDFMARRREGPLLLWVHYTDAHAPYLDPKHGKEGIQELEPYEREVAYTDFHVGRLLAGLERLGVLNQSLVAVTSDHGEDLGRRGKQGHGPDAFEDAIHVPLLLRIPGCAPSAFSEPVSTLQLGATFGVLAGVPISGRSLFQRAGEVLLPVVSEATLLNKGAFRRAIMVERYKLIVDVRSGGRLLFDLASDPGETSDIYSADANARSLLESAYQRWLDHPGRR